MGELATTTGLIKRLRDYATGPAERQSVCDICQSTVAIDHRHLLEPATGKLYCACDACRILFENQAHGRFRTVPDSVLAIPDFEISESELAALGIPIGLAFITLSSAAGPATTGDAGSRPAIVVGWYPSPAGLVQSLPDRNVWESIANRCRPVQNLQADVEALLINHTRNHHWCFVAPIDICYQLVGIVRRHWDGWSGGTQVWEEVDRFFERRVLQVSEGGAA